MLNRSLTTARQWVTLVLVVGSLTAQAVVLPLEGRNRYGNPVNAYDATAVFEYDPNLNITWLRDWNVNGAKSWDDQMTWAAGLNIYGVTGWRLPITPQWDSSCSFWPAPQGPAGYNCTGSEMGYLWYTELLNVAVPWNVEPPANNNTGPFLNMRPPLPPGVPHSIYWSGTEWNGPYPPQALVQAWVFFTDHGYQATRTEHETSGPDSTFYAVAVRDGDLPVDIDGDGVLNSIDLCPNTPADDTVNDYGCSIPQLVPCAGPVMGGEWRNHGQYVSTLTHVAQVFLKDDLITQAEIEALVGEAAQSHCGKKENNK